MTEHEKYIQTYFGVAVEEQQQQTFNHLMSFMIKIENDLNE